MTTFFHEFAAPLPCRTSKGDGFALGFIDYSFEHDIVWMVVLHGQSNDDAGAVWCVPNDEFRVARNWTAKRRGAPDEV